jgi:UDP-N-acetylglucosamine transferase subunit ALG13
VILATGSGIVVPIIWVGRLRGVKTIYVECGGRLDIPSLSCQLVASAADLVYVQSPELTRSLPGAHYAGAIRWDAAPERNRSSRPRGLIFATVGTSVVYPFDRLIRALNAVPPLRPLVIQHGIARECSRHAAHFDFLPFEDLDRYMSDADVIVTHGGIGSVLLALSHRKHPIIMPRRQALKESVDDHQLAFARSLERRGLATVVTNERELLDAIATPRPWIRPQSPDPDLADELARVLHEVTLTPRLGLR